MANSQISFTENAKQQLGMNSSYTTSNNKTLEYGCALEDIAQSHYFTMQVSQIPITYDHPRYGAFLPVKSANFTYVGFDNMSIPVGVYGNLTLMRRKSVGRLSLVLYDNDRDQVEKGIRNWVNNCFPKNGMYVNYLSEIWAEVVYTSYTVKGKANDTLRYMAIPADNYQVSRDYESGGAKLINFGLIIIGETARMSSQVKLEGISTSDGSNLKVTKANAVPARDAIGDTVPSWEKQKQARVFIPGKSFSQEVLEQTNNGNGRGGANINTIR